MSPFSLHDLCCLDWQPVCSRRVPHVFDIWPPCPAPLTAPSWPLPVPSTALPPSLSRLLFAPLTASLCLPPRSAHRPSLHLCPALHPSLPVPLTALSCPLSPCRRALADSITLSVQEASCLQLSGAPGQQGEGALALTAPSLALSSNWGADTLAQVCCLSGKCQMGQYYLLCSVRAGLLRFERVQVCGQCG